MSGLSDKALLKSEYHHFVLPSQLPSQREAHLLTVEDALCRRISHAAGKLSKASTPAISQVWNEVQRVVEQSRHLLIGGVLSRSTLIDAFGDLRRGTLVLHCGEQNAGILIRRVRKPNLDKLQKSEHLVLFESFETSAASEKTLESQQTLLWTFFKHGAVAIPDNIFHDTKFQRELATFLEHCSTESLQRFGAYVDKAGVRTYEPRDTASPELITTFLMTILEAIGKRVYPKSIEKHIRDDVYWKQGAQHPWRRSPRWLTIRLGVLRHLMTHYDENLGYLYYKALLCSALNSLLRDVMEQHLEPEIIQVVQAKLARRLAKLEELSNDSNFSDQLSGLDTVMKGLAANAYESLKRAQDYTKRAWVSARGSIRRRVDDLQFDIEKNRDYFVMKLSNSWSHLSGLWHTNCEMPKSSIIQRSDKLFDQPDKFATCYFQLAVRERDLAKMTESFAQGDQNTFENMAQQLDQYLDSVGTSYDRAPDQNSVMILTTINCWAKLDAFICATYSSIAKAEPIIEASALDALILHNDLDLRRLHSLQCYLGKRVREASSGVTLFGALEEGCLQDHLFEELSKQLNLQELLDRIKFHYEEDKAEKERDWRTMTAEYNRLMAASTGLTCKCYRDRNGKFEVTGCGLCFYRRSIKRLEIGILEHPLPSDALESKAVAFEMRCPSMIATYRDITWKLSAVLTNTTRKPSHYSPNVKGALDADALALYMPWPRPPKPRVVLASSTKAFTETHYRRLKFPTDLEEVFRPNGRRLEYFCTSTNLWSYEMSTISDLTHLCSLVIPRNSPLSNLQCRLNRMLKPHGVSTNEILASQTDCPREIGVHEYISFQSLTTGHGQRWLDLLRELSSSNLNFTKADTALLIGQVIGHVGRGSMKDHIRESHWPLADSNFLSVLSNEIERRLRLIGSNWRDFATMEVLLTMILRIVSFAPEFTRARAMLAEAQSILRDWIPRLRIEIVETDEIDKANVFQRYAVWAALLCRRTLANSEGRQIQLSAESILAYVQASISLGENFERTTSFGDDPLLHKAVIRDLKMVQNMSAELEESILKHHLPVMKEIQQILGASSMENLSRSAELDIFQDQQGNRWLRVRRLVGVQAKEQEIHFNILQGRLLVDNKPLGRLPTEYRAHVQLKELFGDQNIMVYPSGVQGMTYVVAMQFEYQSVHLGIRGAALVVQLHDASNNVWELIPRETFGRSGMADLPDALLDSCVHWLNVESGMVEIRQKPHIWKARAANWLIDLADRKVFKENTQRKVTLQLLSPDSDLYKKISAILCYIEKRQHLCMYKDINDIIHVNMPRLELSFCLTKRGRLLSTELGAEIDCNQDAGTWYGLESKLVLRDIRHSRDRSIIVPFNDDVSKDDIVLPSQSYRERQIHQIKLAQGNTYGHFFINRTLGRLDCAPEPRLLYLKALLHAYTSGIGCDPLTGLTGMEMAMSCLHSASFQPWSPLDPVAARLLVGIAKLTPERRYYPAGLKTLQTVSYMPHLPLRLFCDDYLPAVTKIFNRSEDLAKFAPSTKLARLPDRGSITLHRRASGRFRLYQRPLPRADVADNPWVQGLPYSSRAEVTQSQRARNAARSTALLLGENPDLTLESGLAKDLPNGKASVSISGFSNDFTKELLSELFDVKVSTDWAPLVTLCRGMTVPRNQYQLCFLLGIIAYSENVDMDWVITLISFVRNAEMKRLDLPEWTSYQNFQYNCPPTSAGLRSLISPLGAAYGERHTESDNQASNKDEVGTEARESHVIKLERQLQHIVNQLLVQWPCEAPYLQVVEFEDDGEPFFDVERVLQRVQPEWTRLFKNYELSRVLRDIQSRLRVSPQQQTGFAPPGFIAVGFRAPTCNHDAVSITSLLTRYPLKSTPLLSTFPETLQPLLNKTTTGVGMSDGFTEPAFNDLKKIVETLESSDSLISRSYAQDLDRSLHALLKPTSEQLSIVTLEGIDNQLSSALAMSEAVHQEMRKQISESLYYMDCRHQWLYRGGLFPALDTPNILTFLQSKLQLSYAEGWKEALVAFGVQTTTVQRLARMQHAREDRAAAKVQMELEHCGHQNWDPMAYPDWLLLEIECNMLIRQRQADVARATIDPESGKNSVLQLNMGEGKTSLIIPMVAAYLANGKKLVRIIVPRSLLSQTAQLMSNRLGGLIGREIGHIPFSRRSETTAQSLRVYKELHDRYRRQSAIIVTLPEHVMSFTLSGYQKLVDGELQTAKSLIDLQAWFRSVSRDVLDESDAILAAKTQLIYPSGAHAAVDGHPHRWRTIEEVLRLVRDHVHGVHAERPDGIEIIDWAPDRFPIISIYNDDVVEALLTRIVDTIVQGRVSILPVGRFNQHERAAVREFIMSPKVSAENEEIVKTKFEAGSAALSNAYLLRGLVTYEILQLTLRKRWNVQYGLHAGREPIAVPYNAKNMPNEQAEWGHPDVAIILTCLSFYYSGLKEHQMKATLQHIACTDNPWFHYGRCTQAVGNLPDRLRDWNGINMDDEVQIRELWQNMAHDVNVVNYFLNNLVFPRYAKQFSQRLEGSGWDLPLDGTSTQEGSVTTGFSGTNDNRTLLPLTIRQADLPALMKTNAEVLTHLLESRNRDYVTATDTNGKRLDEGGFLRMLQGRSIRVLIDAGAFVIEMSNFEVARTWLKIDSTSKAALFFDKNSKPTILYRNGKTVPLSASPFARNLKECVVYLDEAHTRGTDLSLEPGCMGALTLGMGQTKDHTVQAAMRLRQLATTQSVLFVSPADVHSSILSCRLPGRIGSIDSMDVVYWLLLQTCQGIEHLQPLYYKQGKDYCDRIQAHHEHSRFLIDRGERDRFKDKLLQAEDQTLQTLYDVKKASNINQTLSKKGYIPELHNIIEHLNHLRASLGHRGLAANAGAICEVEQEREVEHEVEVIREVQKPVKYEPLKFGGLDPDIAQFALNGYFPGYAQNSEKSPPYEHYLTIMARTALGVRHGFGTTCLSYNLQVSHEFSCTIKTTKPNDGFLRPVEYILYSPRSETALIIAPEEAEALLPRLRKAKKPRTHLLIYAAPVTKEMLRAFNDLNFYSYPPLPSDWKAPDQLKMELGIFAGRLHFDYSEYASILRYLRETPNSPPGPQLPTAQPPLFMQEWLALRRKNQDITHEPMGYVCQGKKLTADHPLFAAPRVETGDERRRVALLGSRRDQLRGEEEDDYEDEAAYLDPALFDADRERWADEDQLEYIDGDVGETKGDVDYNGSVRGGFERDVSDEE